MRDAPSATRPAAEGSTRRDVTGPTSASGTGDVVADLALLRLATEGGATRAETAKDLQPLLADRGSP